MKKCLGWALIAAPFVAGFAGVAALEGWLFAARVFGAAAMVMGLMVGMAVGVVLVNDK